MWMPIKHLFIVGQSKTIKFKGTILWEQKDISLTLIKLIWFNKEMSRTAYQSYLD